MRRLALLAGLLVLLVAAPAAALPGDPPVTPVSPADGAAVPADADGVPVVYACPAYRQAEDPVFGTITGLPSDYTPVLATDPTVGPDGRLATTVGTGLGTERANEPGVCDARLGNGGFPRPQSTPGTYYWQVARTCSGCANGFEVGPVVRFTIRSTAEPVLDAPRTAYAGFPVLVTVRVPGAGATQADDVVQRRVGSRWRTVGRMVAGDGPLVRLPRGRQQLRAVSRVGTETLVSPERVVRVRRARGWSTSRRDDGAYRDPQRPSVRFRVTGGGRRISGFQAEIPTTCPGPNTATLALPTVRIAPDGRFALDANTEDGIRRRLVGRLVDGRLRGARAKLVAGSCAGSIAVDARRG